MRDGKGREAHRGREVKTSSGAIPERDLVGYFEQQVSLLLKQVH